MKSLRLTATPIESHSPMSVSDDFDRFKELVDSMSVEWIEKEGDVSCEFSTSSNRLDEKHRYLHTKSKEGIEWKIGYCDTCEKQHATSCYHVEIVS